MSDDQMLVEHKRVYQGFVKGSIWSVVAIFIVLAGMAIFLL